MEKVTGSPSYELQLNLNSKWTFCNDVVGKLYFHAELVQRASVEFSILTSGTEISEDAAPHYYFCDGCATSKSKVMFATRMCDECEPGDNDPQL